MADHSDYLTTEGHAALLARMSDVADDQALMFDPATCTPTNLPTGTVRWSSARNKWQKFNGTTWGDLAATYAISISGNAATVTTNANLTGDVTSEGNVTTLPRSTLAAKILAAQIKYVNEPDDLFLFRNAYAGTIQKILFADMQESVLDGSGGHIAASTEKATPVDADSLGISDSAASFGLKKLTFASLWTWIKDKIESVLFIYASTYSPGAVSSTTNIDSVTVYTTPFFRLGSIAVFGGRMVIDQTAAGMYSFDYNLPIASNFTSILQGVGVLSNRDGESGAIYANATTDKVTFSGTGASAAAKDNYFICLYIIA